MPDIPTNRETGNALTIGIVLAGIVRSLFLLALSSFSLTRRA